MNSEPEPSPASARAPSGFDLHRWRDLQAIEPVSLPWGSLPDWVQRSSEGRPWPGLVLWHQVGPAGDLYVPRTASHTILVRRAVATDLVQRHGGLHGATRFQPGQALVVPAGLPTFWRSTMPRDNLHIDLEPAWLQRVAQAQDVVLQSCFGRDDPVLAAFAQVLLGALDSHSSLDTAFGEHVAQAIALHLLTHYAQPHAALRGGAWLSARQMRRVEEAVRAQPGAAWSVERMAQLAQLSTFHFARAFRATQGLAPHAWLVQQRMALAARLVRESDLPLAEVARHTGHRSAAHFAQVFRRHWGVAPSAYRRST